MYGTLRATVDHVLKKNKSVVLDIDVQGAHSLNQAYPGKCAMIFISPPDLKELECRLRSRGTETEEVIQRRIQNAADEMQHVSKFHKVIVNDDLEKASKELIAFVANRLGLK